MLMRESPYEAALSGCLSRDLRACPMAVSSDHLSSLITRVGRVPLGAPCPSLYRWKGPGYK